MASLCSNNVMIQQPAKKRTSDITFYLIQKSIFVSHSFLLEYKVSHKTSWSCKVLVKCEIYTCHITCLDKPPWNETTSSLLLSFNRDRTDIMLFPFKNDGQGDKAAVVFHYAQCCLPITLHSQCGDESEIFCLLRACSQVSSPNEHRCI